MASLEKDPQGTSLDTVIIFTERMEELASFYQKALDLGPYEHSPNHMGQRVGHVYFGFDQVESLDGKSPAGVTLWFTVVDIQSTFDTVVALGADVRYPPTQKPWGAFLAAVYDLDGNMLGLAQR
jgi:predicted enzyme related to lactoylglutathione lyase